METFETDQPDRELMEEASSPARGFVADDADRGEVTVPDQVSQEVADAEDGE